MPKTFSGAEFSKLLSDGSLRDSLVVFGMVKKSDDPDVLLLNVGGTCQGWARIPIAMIEESGVNWHGKVPCKDHEHDYVEITLKWPQNDEAAVFAELLKQTEAFLAHSAAIEPSGDVATSLPPFRRET